MFLRRFFPDYYFKSVESIPFEVIDKEGIKAIIFDMDNTLVDYKYKYNEELEKWILELKKKNIKFCILSNTPRRKKLKSIGEKLGMQYISNASKPWSKGFKKALEILDESKQNTAIIGDQVFTDIWGGNRFGIKTILVSPITKHEFFITRIKRPLERYVIKNYDKNHNEKYNKEAK